MKVYRMTELLRVLACQRAYMHEYVERLESVAFQGIPRPVGTAIHKGVEVIYRGEPTATAVDMAVEVYNKGWRESLKEPSAEEMDKIDEGLAQVKACVGGYPFRPTTEKVIELEGEIIVPMGWERGLKVRIDRLIRENTLLYVHDTKTTGMSSIDLVVKGYRLSKQFVGYQMAVEKVYGERPAGVMIDVIRKPRTYKRKDGSVTVGEPAFHREPRNFTDEDREGFAPWFHRVVDLIDSGAWIQNTGNCTQWNRVCPFWDLCAFPGMAERIKESKFRRKAEEGIEGGAEVDE